jgi:nicotinate-nucleotide adenylyltransferase
MKNLKPPIGIFGGTFDPIHLGHLLLANEVYNQLNLRNLTFIPCQQSPLKKQPSIASATDRLAMIKLAIIKYPYFQADDIEIKRSGISYTIDTLRLIHQENPDTPICFVMAIDAFAEFKLWRQWQEILQLTHLIVSNRQNSPTITNKEILYLLKERQTFDTKDLQINLAGKIYFLNTSSSSISATVIRAMLKKGKDASQMLPSSVWHYIRQHKLYA